MDKVLWVAAPLVLAAGYALVRALLGKGLPARAVNVWSSVLLLAYVLVTAGLGIFWVANQQLPVFDLHYLFGYGTVLLVGVHLWFNLPAVLRHVRRTSSRQREHATRPVRVGAWLAMGAALLGAFLLGMRHGRTEVSVAWAPEPGGSARPPQGHAGIVDPGPVDVVHRYHELSSHSPRGVVGRAPTVEWGTPPPLKTYPGAARVALPRIESAASRSVSAALRAGPLPRSEAALSLDELGSILFHANGVTDRRGGLLLRASPSSGALFAGELYLAVRGATGVEDGLYHYEPDAHVLERIAGDAAAMLHEVGAPAQGPAAAIALGTIFRRTGHKYRDRAYRYVAADAGHLLENLRLAAAEVGAWAWPLPAYDDRRMEAALGLDGVEEGVMAVIPLRTWAVPAAEGGRAGRADRVFQHLSAPASDGPLGITGLVHRATSLQGHVAATSAPAANVPAPASLRLPAPADAGGGVLAAMARRRSVRDFSGGALEAADLAALLQLASAPPSALSRAVRAHVVVARVEGVPPGAHRYDAQGHALLQSRAGDLASEARAAALAQDVIGDAAAVVVLTLDRATLQAEGARGYRHGFLEAGMFGERLLLEAAARGLGACPVGAFYDAEAAALLGIDPEAEWVVHFAAVGRRG